MEIRRASQTEKKAYALLPRLWETGTKAALAVILEAKGSTPQVAGAAALISAGGLVAGTVGGGSFEAAIIERCQRLVVSGEAQVLEWSFSAAIEEEGSVCGGEALVLLDGSVDKDRPALEKATATIEARRRGILLTTVKLSPAKPIWVHRYFLEAETQAPGGGTVARLDELSIIPSTIPVSAELLSRVLQEETPRLETKKGAQGEIWHLFYEPITPAPRLLVFGAGHVGQALARLGIFLGFEVILFDDREDLPVPEDLLAKVQFSTGDMPGNLAAFPTDEMSYVVIVTRGHRHDAAVLRVALGKKLAYIGMMGSRRKVALMREEFIGQGWATEEKWAEVHSPVGLDIGAVTVEELAVSIMAEIIKVRRRKEKLG